MQAAAVGPAPTRELVWGRAAVLAAVAFGTGVISHVAGGGFLPHPFVLALLFAAGTLAAAGLLRVRATATRLVLLVVAGQTATHGLLAGLAGHRGESPPPGAPDVLVPVVSTSPGERTGNLFDQYAATYGSPATGGGTDLSGGGLAHQVDHLTAQGPAMVLSHLAGAVALGLFLAVGERALWQMLHLVGSRAQVAVAGWRLVLLAQHVRAGIEVARSCVRPLVVRSFSSQILGRGAVRRRGPPQLLAA